MPFIEDLLPEDAGPVRDTRGVSGGITYNQHRRIREHAEAIPFKQHVIDTATAPVANLTININRMFMENDPEYDQAKRTDYYMQGLSERHRNKFVGHLGVKSDLEAQTLRDQIIQDEQIILDANNAGAKGLAGMMLGAAVDPIQAPLMLMSGGTYTGAKVASKLAQTKLKGTRTAGALSVGAAGAEAGLYTGVLEAAVRPAIGAEEIPEMVAGGIVFGGLIGTASKYDYGISRSTEKLKDDISDIASDIATDQPVGVHKDTYKSTGSVGAKLSPESKLMKDFDVESRLPDGDVASYKADRQEFIDLGLSDKYEFNADTPGGRAALNLQSLQNQAGILIPINEQLKELGTTGSVLAYKHTESALGLATNNTSSAAYMDMFYKDALIPITHAAKWRHLRDAWAKDRDYTLLDIHATQRNKVRADFSKDVTKYRAALYRGESIPEGSFPPSVVEMSELLDEVYKRNLINAQGDGTNAIKGFETLEAKAGWSPQKWLPKKIQDVIYNDKINNPTFMKKAIVNTLIREYSKLGIDRELSEIYAKSLVTRQLAKADDIDVNVIRMLTHDGEALFKQKLQDIGMTVKEAERTIKSIKGLDADKGKIASARSRLDIDPRTRIEGTDYMLMDLIENDIFSVPARYSRSVSGSAALARNGTSLDELREDLQRAGRQKVAAGGVLTEADEDLIANLPSYFGAGPINGGVHPVVRRAIQATNMALLPQVGLTQLGETGASMAAVGMKNFMQASKEVLRATDDIGKSMLSQLENADFVIGHNKDLFDPESLIEDIAQSDYAQSVVGSMLDQTLSAGSRATFIVSGMFKVMETQQKILTVGLMHRLNDQFTTGAGISAGRLADMGLEGKLLDNVSKYFTNGTVKQIELPDGTKSLDLGFDKWNPQDIEGFRLAVYRFNDQMVQKARTGEENILWNNSFGRAVTHLRTFPLVALAKTTGRNIKHADATSVAMLGYGLATAGMAYSAKQIINGREENLTVENVTKGALGYSNMTSVFPMFYDPLMSMLGQEDLRLNNFRNDISGDILSLPPIVPTMNRMLHIPEALIGTIGGEPTKSDIYALQTTPLLGKMYGVSYAMHKAKEWAGETTRERKREERRLAREKAKEKEDKKKEKSEAEKLGDKLPKGLIKE